MTAHARRALDAAFHVHGIAADWTPSGALEPAGAVMLLPVPEGEQAAAMPGMISRPLVRPFLFRVRAYEAALDPDEGGAAPAAGGVFRCAEDARYPDFSGRAFQIDGAPKRTDRFRFAWLVACHDPARFEAPQA